MSEPLDPEIAILNEALEFSGAERAAYLDRACGGDAALREQVEALLAVHPRVQSFMEAPPTHLELKKTELLQVPITEKPGDNIGRYKLLQQIGEGGCGVVYMAEQEEPVRRRVALKVIKLGMDTKQVIARFEAERQALALMDHPNIAKVLDAGATDAGRPYFVMELVRGTRITEFCDEAKTSTADRLHLFIQVCQAIQHAHQKGIIHRDIKPSNILVTINDGVPVPKVIDFGIAKATSGRLTDRTLFTAFEQFMGTPAYMSPEQAVMTSLDIDTRSDIYSLGVLLYELLTGATPFDARALFEAGFEEMRRTIREKEPLPPSARLSTMAAEALKTTAQLRHTDPPKLMHVVRGDLDWIVMKCLEKDRGRRYESASGLAADLQRHLHHEPVLARPPGGLYRFQKLVRRHKLAFAAGAAIAVSLLVGLGLSLWQYREKSRAFERAVEAEKKQDTLRRRAQTEAAKSDQVAQFLRDMLKSVGPSVARGRDVNMLREVLDATARHVGEGLGHQPAVEAELRDTLGQVYLELGLFEQAETMQREALRLLRSLPDDQGSKVAGLLNNLGVTLVKRSRFAEGEAMYREALALRREFAGDESPEVTQSLLNLAALFPQQGRLVESEATLRDILQRVRRAPKLDEVTLAKALSGLGLVVQRLGRRAEADTLLQEALTLQRRVFGEDSLEVLATLNMLGNFHSDAGRLADAEETFRSVVATARRFYGEEHPMVAQYVNNLAYLLRRRGQLEESERLLRGSIEVYKKSGATNQLELAASLSNLGNVLRDRFKFEEGEATLREAIRMRMQLVGENADTLGDKMNLAVLLHTRGRTDAGADMLADVVNRLRTVTGTNGMRELPVVLVTLSAMRDAQKRYAEAESVARDAIALCQAQDEKHPLLARARLNLALALQHQKRFAEAERLLLESIEVMAAEPQVRETPDLANALHNLAIVLEHQGRTAEAEGRYREAIAAWRKALGNDHPNLARSLHNLAGLLIDRRRYADAETAAREALAIRRQRFGNEHADTIDALWNLALILEYRKQWAASETQYVEAIALQKKVRGEPQTANLNEHLAMVRLKLNKFADAEAAARACLAAREQSEAENWRTFDNRSLLGEALLAQNKAAEAEPLLLAGYDGLKQREPQIPPSQKNRLDQAIHRLVRLHEETGRPEQAAEWKRRLTKPGK